jgi:hypothetical protein
LGKCEQPFFSKALAASREKAEKKAIEDKKRKEMWDLLIE